MDSERGSLLGVAATIVTICITIGIQLIQVHERLSRMESLITSEATLCDCFQTRSRVAALEYRINELEQEVEERN